MEDDFLVLNIREYITNMYNLNYTDAFTKYKKQEELYIKRIDSFFK